MVNEEDHVRIQILHEALRFPKRQRWPTGSIRF